MSDSDDIDNLLDDIERGGGGDSGDNASPADAPDLWGALQALEELSAADAEAFSRELSKAVAEAVSSAVVASLEVRPARPRVGGVVAPTPPIVQPGAPAKRGPGRPSKVPPAPRLKVLGIVNAPCNPDSQVELSYDDPVAFRGLLAYLKAARVSTFDLHCDEWGITVYARPSQASRSEILARLEGEKMNLYYCSSPVRLLFSREQCDSIIQAIDKTVAWVSIVIAEGDESHMSVILQCPASGNEITYTLSAGTAGGDEYLAACNELLDLKDEEFSEAVYPVRFSLSAACLKKLINDSGRVAAEITLTVHGEGDRSYLVVSGQGSKTDVVYSSQFAAKSISLEHKADPDFGMFEIGVSVADLRNIAASTVTPVHTICLDRERPLIIESALDDEDAPAKPSGRGLHVYTFVLPRRD